MNQKTVKLYAIVTQGFIQTFVLIYLGYKIGHDWWLKSSTYGALFAGLGAIIGIILMILNIMKVGGIFDKRKDI